MGKKSKLKKIRAIAQAMPEIPRQVVKGERVKGAELLKDGIKEIEGKPINEEGFYRKKTLETQALNHERQMKALYNKHGVQGVNAYIQSVQRYVTAKKVQEQNAKIEKSTNEEIQNT